MSNENPTYATYCECGERIKMDITGLKNVSHASVHGSCVSCGKITSVKGRL